jgi:hypothetical protein
MTLFLIKPESVEKGSVYSFSGQIINELRRQEELCVVGIGSAISLASMAVQRSCSIAKIAINELSLNYIGSPTLGLGGVFLVLNKESKRNWDSEKKKLEKGMKLSFERDGQLIIVSRNLLPEEVIPLCLSKLAKSELLKISATGNAINRAALIALELTKGDIARDELGIELVTLSTVEFEISKTNIPETAMDIFIRKGAKTFYSKKHEEILKILENR